MSNLRRFVKPVLSLLIVLCVAFFFYRAFQRNWASIRAHEFRIAPLYLVGSALAAAVTTLLATLGWYRAINALSKSKLSFRQSIAAVNASSLTKYVPGKIWSYALQMYWLDGLGFSKALIVYVNLLNLLISLGTGVLMGLLCLLLSTSPFPRILTAEALLALLALDVACVLYQRAILNGSVRLINRLFKKSLAYFEISRSLLIELHVIHLVAAVTFGASAYWFAFAIGYRIDLGQGLLLIASSLLSEVAGFLAIVVPGGIGVREGLIYAMLAGSSTGSLALIFPLASRAMNMTIDIVLGAIALKLLRTLSRETKARAAASPNDQG
jgi:glycosyltransferase 2 family protein